MIVTSPHKMTHALVELLRQEIEEKAARRAAQIYGGNLDLNAIAPEQIDAARTRLIEGRLEGDGEEFEVNRVAMRGAIKATTGYLEELNMLPRYIAGPLVNGMSSLDAGGPKGIAVPIKSAAKGDRLRRKQRAMALAAAVHFTMGLKDMQRETAFLDVAGIKREGQKSAPNKDPMLPLHMAYSPAMRLLADGERQIGSTGREEAEKAGRLKREGRSHPDTEDFLNYLQAALAEFSK